MLKQVDSQRIENIEDMLRRFHEAREQEGGLPGERSSDRLLRMPRTWNKSFQELERCLLVMRKLGNQKAVRYEKPSGDIETIALRTAYWHVCAWYMDAQAKPVAMRREVIVKGRKRSVPVMNEYGQPALRIEYVRHRDARPDKARAGVVWLAQLFRGSPCLPNEMNVREAA